MEQLPSLPRRSTLFSVIGLVAFLCLLTYGESLSNSFVRWDDGLLIYENTAIRGISLANLKTIFSSYDPELYIPLTLFSYQIDYMISGVEPAFYHLHNLVLHIVNATLVVLLAYLFIRRKWISLFIGLLFALHPLNTEAVVWASARKDLLSTLFFLLSIASYLYYMRSVKRPPYYVSLLMFTLALLSKVTVITLPIVLLFIDWQQKRVLSKSMFIEKIPYFALSIAFGIIAMFGKTAVLGSSSLTEKILIPIKSSWFYLEKLFVPIKLSVLYPLTDPVTLREPTILIPALLIIVIICLTIYSLLFTRVFVFCIAWFFLTVSPTVLNFSKGDFIYFASDRYAYIPSIGILLLVGWGLAHLTKNMNQRNISIAAGTCVFVVGLCSVMSMVQARTWESTEALFSNTLKNYPNTAVARNNIGNHYSLLYRQQGLTQKAIEEYEQALVITRAYSRNMSVIKTGESKILSNMASAYRQIGDYTKSEELYKESLALNPANPYALLGLGIIAAERSDIVHAEQYYQSAIELRPNLTTPRINLGSLYVQTGRIEEAIATLEEAVNLNPFYPQAHYNLGVALRKVERNREALDAYEKAIELEPSFVAARINLGILYAERKKISEAIEQFTEVLKYNPQNARAKAALIQLGAG